MIKRLWYIMYTGRIYSFSINILEIYLTDLLAGRAQTKDIIKYGRYVKSASWRMVDYAISDDLENIDLIKKDVDENLAEYWNKNRANPYLLRALSDIGLSFSYLTDKNYNKIQNNYTLIGENLSALGAIFLRNTELNDGNYAIILTISNNGRFGKEHNVYRRNK
jgi:uncharacterized protein (UPF0128 family)